MSIAAAPGKRSRRTQAQRRAAAREKITTATISSLAEVGYGATTIEGVAARAGTSRGGVLHYFPSKADLVIGSMDSAAAAFLARLDGEEAKLPSGPGRVEAALDVLYDACQSEVFAAAVVIQSTLHRHPEEHELQAANRRLQDAFLERTPAMFGVPPSKRLKRAIHMVVATLRGSILMDPVSEGGSAASWPFMRRELARIVRGSD